MGIQGEYLREKHRAENIIPNPRKIGRLTVVVVVPGWEAGKHFPMVAGQFLRLTQFAVQTLPDSKRGVCEHGE